VLLTGRVEAKKRLGPYHYLRVRLPQAIGPLEAGHFALLEAPAPEAILLRPFSLFDFEEDQSPWIAFLFQRAGKGTEALASVEVGRQLRAIVPLGTPFPLPHGGEEVLLLAGGVGIAPLFPLARRLSRGGLSVRLLWGAKSPDGLPYPLLRSLRRWGVEVAVATEDGGLGHRGLVTELLQDQLPSRGVLYLCGPEGMIREALSALPPKGVRSFVSLEERMACGVGACLGCAVKTREGYRLLCSEGPVLPGEVLQWR